MTGAAGQLLANVLEPLVGLLVGLWHEAGDQVVAKLAGQSLKQVLGLDPEPGTKYTILVLKSSQNP